MLEQRRNEFCQSGELSEGAAVKCWLTLWTVLILLASSGGAANFDPVKDTFAFSNETFFAYGDRHQDAADTSIKTGVPYSRRCFVLCRAAIQFHQFARFEPSRPRLSEAEIGRLIRRIARVPVSQKQKSPLISVPGFANLQEFSAAHPRLLQENLGTWWPTYFRFGNWRMVFPFPRSGQEKLAARLVQRADAHELAAIYITRFKPLNHCLVVHRYLRTKTGLLFDVYDPNLPGQICQLTFDEASRSFSYQRTWYYPGGRVNALEVYHTRWL